MIIVQLQFAYLCENTEINQMNDPIGKATSDLLLWSPIQFRTVQYFIFLRKYRGDDFICMEIYVCRGQADKLCSFNHLCILS